MSWERIISSACESKHSDGGLSLGTILGEILESVRLTKWKDESGINGGFFFYISLPSPQQVCMCPCI